MRSNGNMHPDPGAVPVLCAGGCGAMIQVPFKLAEAIAEGRVPRPKCLSCVGREAPAKADPGVPPLATTRPPTESGQEEASPALEGHVPGGAPGSAPERTTLVMTRRKGPARKGRASEGYTVELHPCIEDRDVPQWQLLSLFARALLARARAVAPADKLPKPGAGGGRLLPLTPKGEGLGATARDRELAAIALDPRAREAVRRGIVSVGKRWGGIKTGIDVLSQAVKRSVREAIGKTESQGGGEDGGRGR